MKQNKFLLLAIIPLLLTGCKHKGVSFTSLLKRVENIADTHEHPYYKVVGSIDIHGMVTEISEEDGTFVNMPNGESYVENSRYYEGFYNEVAEYMSTGGASDYQEDEIKIFGMASRSYWLRMPIRLHQDNFYALRENGKLNMSCGYANLRNLIVDWKDAYCSVNGSNNKMYFELLSNGGFAIGGDNVRTKIYIDNYPYYMSYTRHPELGEWSEDDPLPCYSFNDPNGYIDGKFNIRFVYDKDGWLKSEYLATSDYDYNKTIESQLALKSVYSYRFS